MKNSEFQFILKVYGFWFLTLFLILIFSVKFVSLQGTFLGGGQVTYILNPYFWTWANFDGKHYSSIAMFGYGFGQYPFFPLYPILIDFFGKIFGNTNRTYVSAGVFISHVSFLIALTGFYKLLRLDFKEKFTKKVLICLLLFPTSFYFASVYTESLFLALSVWSFYFARQGKWLYATLLGILLTSSRFVGIILLPSLLVEWFIQRKEAGEKLKFPEVIFAIPTGILAYMYYLEGKAHDMFAFFNNLALFGEQRSTHLITLPQVFFRYVFKIIPNLHTTFLPIIFTTFFEVFIGVFYLFLSIFAFLRIRSSYAVFLSLGYIIPTFSGSFSSLPRYVLILFPAYIVLVKIFGVSKNTLFTFYVISFILLFVSFMLFSRGYWLS